MDYPINRKEPLLRDNPAVWKRDWLPEGVHAELDVLRASHQDALAACEEAADELIALRKSYEDEDEAQIQAIRDGEDPPEPTPREVREQELTLAGKKHEVAEEKLASGVREAVAVIQANQDSYLADLSARETGAKAIAEEARKALEAAELEVRRLVPMRRWIVRTAEDRRGFHIASTDLGVPPAEKPLDPARIHGTGEPDPDLSPRPEDDQGPDQEVTEDENSEIGVS